MTPPPSPGSRRRGGSWSLPACDEGKHTQLRRSRAGSRAGRPSPGLRSGGVRSGLAATRTTGGGALVRRSSGARRSGSGVGTNSALAVTISGKDGQAPHGVIQHTLRTRPLKCIRRGHPSSTCERALVVSRNCAPADVALRPPGRARCRARPSSDTLEDAPPRRLASAAHAQTGTAEEG